MIRIAFLINFKAKSWIGGYNFIINLIDSLRFLNSKKIQPVLIVGKKFNTKDPWRKAYPGAYLAARRLGIYKKVTKHMKVLFPKIQQHIFHVSKMRFDGYPNIWTWLGHQIFFMSSPAEDNCPKHMLQSG